jgi:hypothetical protein
MFALFQRFYGARRVPLSSKWGNKNYYKGNSSFYIRKESALALWETWINMADSILIPVNAAYLWSLQIWLSAKYETSN